MAFYEEKQAGDFLPYIGFNAKADKWFLNVNKEKVQLKGNIEFVLDYKNMKTGWFLFQDGLAPNVVFDASLTERAAQPSAKHKRGVRFPVLIKGEHPGVYEFSSVAGNVLKPLSELHDLYLAEAAKNPNVAPVVKVGDSVEVKSSFKNPDGSNGSATNYMPTFKIASFITRPAALDEVPEQVEEKPAPTPEPKAEKAAASANSEW
jgi:hypothetical protein